MTYLIDDDVFLFIDTGVCPAVMELSSDCSFTESAGILIDDDVFLFVDTGVCSAVIELSLDCSFTERAGILIDDDMLMLQCFYL